MFCFNCGEEISSNAAYCPHCGCRTYLPKNSRNPAEIDLEEPTTAGNQTGSQTRPPVRPPRTLSRGYTPQPDMHHIPPPLSTPFTRLNDAGLQRCSACCSAAWACTGFTSERSELESCGCSRSVCMDSA